MGKRILIVDDSSMMRKMVARTLTGAGHTIVCEARNGLEALAYYSSQRPDLVTMDITMAKMDGLTAARKILEQDPKAKILFLSNLDEEKYRQEVKSIGAVGFVNKHRSKEILALLEGLSTTPELKTQELGS